MSLQAATFTRKPTSAALRLFALCVCALPLINRGAGCTVLHSVTLLKVSCMAVCPRRHPTATARCRCSISLGYALRSRFLVTHWRFHRTSPCIFRTVQRRFRGSLRRAVGGSWQTASGQAPNFRNAFAHEHMVIVSVRNKGIKQVSH